MKTKQTEQRKFLTRILMTGWIGGILWSLFAIVLYQFNFIEVRPKSYLLHSWLGNEFVSTWKGTLLTIFIASLISIGVSFIYYLLFKKVNSIFMGIGFGVMIWLIFVFITQYTFPNIKPFTDFDKVSMLSSICIFILYGTFIGYSISFDYYETYILKTKQITK